MSIPLIVAAGCLEHVRRGVKDLAGRVGEEDSLDEGADEGGGDVDEAGERRVGGVVGEALAAIDRRAGDTTSEIAGGL